MDRELFCMSDVQFAKIAPHLPTDTRGKPRVGDRRVISGIIQVLKSGGRWIDAPPDYGRARPSTTASSAGPPKAYGPISSRRWPPRADRRPTC